MNQFIKYSISAIPPTRGTPAANFGAVTLQALTRGQQDENSGENTGTGPIATLQMAPYENGGQPVGVNPGALATLQMAPYENGGQPALIGGNPFGFGPALDRWISQMEAQIQQMIAAFMAQIGGSGGFKL